MYLSLRVNKISEVFIMAKDYSDLAGKIVKSIGGKNNIDNAFHCATRLRFQLKDISKAETNIDKIKDYDGVLDVVVQTGQFQIVIGPNVADVFKYVQSEIGTTYENKSEDSDDQKNKSKFDRFFEIVSGMFTPIVPVLMASGMVGALLTILNIMGVLSTKSPTYFLLNVIYEAGFYFLPFFIAASSSKVFHANRYLSMLLAGIMLYPKLFEFKAAGISKLTFLGMNVPQLDYGKAVLPVILGVWLLSYLEKFFDKIMPDILKAFMTPLLVMCIMLPIQLMIIGPLGNNIANYLAMFVQWMGNSLGFFAVGVLAFLTPLMIATGTHSFAFPVIVATLTSLGYDQLLMPSMVAENLAMAGAAFGIALYEKNKKKKSQAFSASLTAILGISEPAMYGFVIPSGYGFLGAMFGGFVGGIFAGIFKFRMYMIASSSVIGIPAMFGKNAGISNVVVGCLEIIISFISAAFFTLALKKTNLNLDKILKRKKNSSNIDTKKTDVKPVAAATFNKGTNIMSPVEGNLEQLSTLKDKVFSSGAMGQGIAIQPKNGLIKAPDDGTIELVYPTGHAIGMKTKDGAEILIHIGMDTVNLNGKGFTTLVKQDQKVKKGDPLVKVDLKMIKESGYDTVTPVIVTNSASYHNIKTVPNGDIKYGQKILTLV